MTTEESLSVVRIRDVLVATVPAHPSDETIGQLQERILSTIQDDPENVTGVVLDISPVNIMDSFFARTVAETVQMIELLGTHPVLVGMRPSVAITATELGYTLGDVDTAMNTDAALDTIRTASGDDHG